MVGSVLAADKQQLLPYYILLSGPIRILKPDLASLRVFEVSRTLFASTVGQEYLFSFSAVSERLIAIFG